MFYNDKRNTPHNEFVPELVRLIRKYSLEMYLLDFMQTVFFRHTYQWKTLVRNAITGKAESEWYSRLNIFLSHILFLLNRFIVIIIYGNSVKSIDI